MTHEPSFDVERESSNVSATNAKALSLAEDAVRDCEEKYRLLLDGIEDYAIFMIDPQGQVLSWNAGAERIKGYKAEEIIGRNFSFFFPQQDIERGRPEKVLRLTAAYGRHEEQGMRVRKDGSRFVASVTFTALRDRNGSLRGYSEFSHDLSESKESEARYRGLLEKTVGRFDGNQGEPGSEKHSSCYLDADTTASPRAAKLRSFRWQPHCRALCQHQPPPDFSKTLARCSIR
jgi:PAS domain S-box-containing protein